MDRTKNATRNMFWGIMGKIIAIVLPFIIRTVMIYTMGMNYVGLGSLFTSILQVLSFAELGIGGALVFSMYRPIAEGNDKKVCALLNFYKKTYRVIGIVILLVGLCMMPFLNNLIASDLPEGINLYILFGIYLLNNVLGYFLFAYKQSLLSASQRVDVISKIGMILQLFSGVAQVVLLLTLKNYYAYVIVVPIITCVNNICIGVLTDKYYPQYKCKGLIEKDELTSIKKKVGGMVFQKIGGIILSSVDTIVISAFLGLKSLALYQNYYYIVTAIFGFLGVIMQSIIAGVGNSVASESVKKNYKDFKKFNFMYIWIVSWSSICLLCLYQPFMVIWVGKENMFDMEMVLLFVIYFFVYKWCDMLYVYQEACGIWWETKFVPLIAAVVNLAINIILVQIIGLPGILISTIVAVVFIYDTGYARVLFKTYFVQTSALGKYWIRQGFYFLCTIGTAFFTYFLCSKISVNAIILKLVLNSIVCIIVPNMIFIILFSRLPEFKAVINAGKGMLKHYVKKKN